MCTAPGRKQYGLCAGLSASPDLCCCTPSSHHMEGEGGLNLHHEAGTDRSPVRVYASNINMLENMSQNMSAGQESINFKREFANPTLI